MSSWSTDGLQQIEDAVELRVSSRRADDTLRPFATIWVGRVGENIYIRSAAGPQNGWFRRARAAGRGRIEAGGVTRDVTFAPADPAVRADLDAALHRKYDRYGPGPVGEITGADVLETTLVVVPEN